MLSHFLLVVGGDYSVGLLVLFVEVHVGVLTGDLLQLITVIDLEVDRVVNLKRVVLVVLHLVDFDHVDLIHHDFALHRTLRQDIDLILLLGRRWSVQLVWHTLIVSVEIVLVNRLLMAAIASVLLLLLLLLVGGELIG